MAKLTVISEVLRKAKAKTLPMGTLVRLPWRDGEVAVVTLLGWICLTSNATWSNFALSEVEVLSAGFKIEPEQQALPAEFEIEQR